MGAFINKWIHLTSMAGAVGGLFFGILFQQPDHDDLWKKVGRLQGVFWILAIVTGFINMMIVSPKVNAGYQMLLGIKMLLAIGMFIFSMMLFHPLPGPLGKVVAARKPILVLLVVVAIAVLGISGRLNMSRVDGSGLKSAAVAN